MTKWPEVALGDVCVVTMGQAPPGDAYNDRGEGWPLVAGAGDFRSERLRTKKFTTAATRLTAPGDIVLGIRATIGEKALADGVYCLGRGVAALRPGPALDGRYLWHWLTTVRRHLAAHGRGATFLQVNKQDICNLSLPLAPIEDQRRIAAILDRTDEVRAKRSASVAILDSLTEAVFLDLFGDPVVNSRGWRNPTLGGALARLEYGHRFYNESYSSEGIPVVRITDLSESGDLDFSAMPRMALTAEERLKYTLTPGDLVFARSGATVGKVALMTSRDPECIAGAYFMSMRFSDAVEPEYAKAVLTSASIRAIIAKQSRQAAQQNFSGPALRRLPMPIPPLDLQRRFARIAEAARNSKAALRANAHDVDTLFASLQHRAFSGQL